MIRRISANNDYMDIIRSCPSGVIDDIYEVEYYVDGYSNVYSASFSKKGSLLEVIIPSSALQTLPSGLLMRRAKYKNADTSFPDQYYDLEFVEDMNVWLEGDGTSPGPGPASEYVTEEELEETLDGYVTGDDFNNEVNDIKDHINAVEDSLSGYVTDQVFAAHVAENAAQFNNVDAQIQSVDDSVLATNAHLQSVDDRVTVLEQRPAGVSQEQFDAHVAQNGDQFNNLTQGVQQAQSTADSAASQAAKAHQRALQAIQKNDAQDATLENHNIRITELENAGFATLSDVQSMIGEDIQTVQGQIDGLDQRVTDLEQGGTGGGSWGSITGDIQDQQDLVDYVDQAIEDAISGSDIPLPENVVEYDVNHPLIEEFGLNVDVLKRNEFDHGTDVITKGLVLGYEEIKENGDITDINTIEIRNGLLQAVCYSYDGVDYFESRDPYATESWVGQQGYLTSNSTLPADQITCNISGDVFDFDDVDEGLRALVSRVEDQIDEITLLDDRVTALEQAPSAIWGSITGTITNQTDLMTLLGDYATQQWATNQFLEESKVWTGTETQWDQLSAAQKASYTIALITQ